MSVVLADPWQVVGWVLLAVLAVAYIGGVWELWSERRSDSWARRSQVLATVLALVWPLGLGAVVVQWMRNHS